MTVMRCDMVTVFVLRRGGTGPEFLQLHRAPDPAGKRLGVGLWQPIMGAIEAGETAPDAARRELREEVGLDISSDLCVNWWSINRVRPFYCAARDAVVLSPAFAVEVTATWTPRLNDEHDAHRWVALGDVRDKFMWPDQIDACAEVAEFLLRPGSTAEAALRLPR